MAVCDICNGPGVGTLVSGDTFCAAIQKGFCPFRLGLDNDMGMAAIREEWRREALKSGTDWNLCNACYTKFQRYAPKAAAALGVTQTQSGGRSVAQLQAEHELAVAQAVLREDYVKPEVLADYGQLFQATKLLAAARVAALEIQLEAHNMGRPASSYPDYGKNQIQLDLATNIVKQLSMRAEKSMELNKSETKDEMKPLLKAEIDELNAEIEFRLQQLNNKSDCFIATATYGSPFAPEVSVFRRFRDEVLLSSIPGSMFVKVYYLVSPPWASLISKAPPLRNATRYLLLAPILSLLKMAERNKD